VKSRALPRGCLLKTHEKGPNGAVFRLRQSLERIQKSADTEDAAKVMPLLDVAYMSDLTQQACSAWRTMCNNHLIYAAYRHMAMMLIALFWDDYLDNDEAYQLAKHIGRCRDTLASRERNKTVVKLPNDRPAQSHVKWRGAIVDRPAMTQHKWTERVQRLRNDPQLFSATNRQDHLLAVRYQWLLRIEQTNEKLKLIPGLSEVRLKSFSLLPLAHHGRVFLGLSDEFLENLWRRYETGHLRVTSTGLGKQLPQGLRLPQAKDPKTGSIVNLPRNMFDRKWLHQVSHHGQWEFAGQWLKTNGVASQLHFLEGGSPERTQDGKRLPSRIRHKKKKALPVEGDGNAAADSSPVEQDASMAGVAEKTKEKQDPKEKEPVRAEVASALDSARHPLKKQRKQSCWDEILSPCPPAVGDEVAPMEVQGAAAASTSEPAEEGKPVNTPSPLAMPSSEDPMTLPYAARVQALAASYFPGRVCFADHPGSRARWCNPHACIVPIATVANCPPIPMMKWFSRKKKVVTDEGKKTAAKKKKKPDDDAQVKEEEAEEKYDSVFTVRRICDLYAVDPGRDDLITLVRAIPLPHSHNHKGRAPLTVNCKGEHVCIYVKFEVVYRLSKAQYADMCGRTHAMHYRHAIVERHPEYTAAVNRMKEHSLKVSAPKELAKNIAVHFATYKAISNISASRRMARLRFDTMMRTQQAMDTIANIILPPNEPDRIVAWGGAKWAHAAKGFMPCSAAKIYRYISELPRATFVCNGVEYTRVPKVDEYNTSCKCCDCLSEAKQVNPTVPEYQKKKWMKDPLTGKRKKMKVLLTDHEVYKLLQCEAKGCRRTHGRDRCGGGNIWRVAFEESHGGQRPATLRRPSPPTTTGGAPAEPKKKRDRKPKNSDASASLAQPSAAETPARKRRQDTRSASTEPQKKKSKLKAPAGSPERQQTRTAARTKNSRHRSPYPSGYRADLVILARGPPSGETGARETTPNGAIKRFGACP